MEVIAASNWVVKSDVESPSSNSPSAAYVGVRIYNDSDGTLTDVAVKIGDLTDAGTGAGMPGTFPSRVNPQGYAGTIALQMPGGAADAVRSIPSIAPHSYVAEYFFVTYPLKDNLGHAVTGVALDTSDDLWLNYDIWASASAEAATRRVDQTTKITLRNEIASVHNKIWPNSKGRVPPEYRNATQEPLGWRPNVATPRIPGAVVMEGIWFDLGEIGEGFDNNLDGLPDRNIWLQPVGDPTKFSPLAARLIKCYGLVVVKLNSGTEQLIPFEDRLYFDHIPSDNLGAVGMVFYGFIPLDAALPSQLTPYQEVAAGYANEKFNGDYGMAVGAVSGTPPKVAFTKTGPAAIAAGSSASYTLAAANNETFGSNRSFGWPEYALPVVFQDNIPAGMVYVAGSATAANTPPAGQTCAVSWSTNGGSTWTTTEPSAASVTTIRWTLSGALAPGSSAAVKFFATVPSNYSGVTISNTGYLKKGTDTPFAAATAVTRITGLNSCGGLVWRDLNSDRLQNDGAGNSLADIDVTLYYDANANSVLDAGDPVYGSTQTYAGGRYDFSNLPDGVFFAVVNQDDPDLPAGHTLPDSVSMTRKLDLDATHASSSAVSDTSADWGFIAALEVVNSVAPTTCFEGDLITYNIDLKNHASPILDTAPTVQTAFASSVRSSGQLQNPAYAQGSPDGNCAVLDWHGVSDSLTTAGGFAFSSNLGAISKVELVLHSYLTRALVDDNATLSLGISGIATTPFEPGGVAPLSTAVLNTMVVGGGVDLVVDITSKVSGAWTLAQLQSLVVSLATNKNSSNDDGKLYTDSIGIRVTAPSAAASASFGSSSISPLSLVDTYDSTRLQFVSASVAPTSTSTATPAAATLTWSDLGPLNTGAVKSLTVTFRALPVGDATGDGVRDSAVTTNRVDVTNAAFVSGRRANDATSNVNVTICPTGSTGGFVFWDVDGNNAYNSGDMILQNVIVSLYNGLNVLQAQAITDASGRYLFSGLADGSYYVFIETASGTQDYSLPWSSGVSVTYDPNGAPYSATGPTVVINSTDAITTNDTYTNQDFGFRSNTRSMISGSVFMDNNGNGVQDAGENPIVGCTVTLSGTNSGTVITDATGYYRFSNLAVAGASTVTVTPPAATVQTLDPDAVRNNATTITVALGNAYTDRKFGYKPTGSLTLGGSLYHDWNGNGVQDSGEAGIPNVDVLSYEDANADGVVDPVNDACLATATTNSGGTYGFTGLPAGHYVVVVNLSDPDFPAGVHQTQDSDGVPDNKAVVYLATSANAVHFGYQPNGTGSGTIGNLVWQDTNNNGIRDMSESGIDGVTLQLYRSAGTPGTSPPIATTTTSGGGFYGFTSLAPGNYVVYIPGSNFSGNGALVGSPLSSTTTDTQDDAVDHDDNGGQAGGMGTAVTSPVITLATGESDNTKDFGFTGCGSIGDFVYYDSNRNGQPDYSEPGIPNVTVNLYLDANADGVADSATPVATVVTSLGSTSPAGYYRFDNVAPGTYYLQVDAGSLPKSGGNPIPQTADPDLDGVPVSPPTYVGDHADSRVVVISGSNYSGGDFGYKPAGAVGDFVWLDLNQNGVQDAGEPGIAGASVQITNGTTTYNVSSDFDGCWSKILADGNWTVSITSSNFSAGGSLANLAPTYDADGVITANTVTLAVTSGNVNLAGSNLGIDFGYKISGSYSLSGTVAIHDTGVIGVADDVDDVINDGVDMDAGPNDETELGGVEVFLHIAGGQVLGSTLTDAKGKYSFTGLASGTYKVLVGTTAAPLNHAALTTTTANNIGGATLSNTASSVTQQLSMTTGSVSHVDFMFNSTVNYDYGDLPLRYGMTTLAQDGARHIIPAGGSTVYLGSPPDAESNGMPTATASGDDSSGSSDEDGVVAVAPGTWTHGAAASNKGGKIQINVTGGGWLVGWIDWNLDGSFLNADEMIVNQAVSSGSQIISFDIPAGINTNGSHSWLSRFRIFTTEPVYPLFSYSGEAYDGEVEDFLFMKPAGSSISDYDTWASVFTESGFSDRATDSDPDHDSMSNQAEYAFGLDPTLAVSGNPIVRGLGSDGTFNYTRRDPSLTGLTYTVWTSTDLRKWEKDVEAGAGQMVQTTGIDHVQTVWVKLTHFSATGKLFMRVQAE